MNVPPMAPAMARTEICSLTIAPSIRDRLLRGGFRTLRDLEGVQPSVLARGTVQYNERIIGNVVLPQAVMARQLTNLSPFPLCVRALPAIPF